MDRLGCDCVTLERRVRRFRTLTRRPAMTARPATGRDVSAETAAKLRVMLDLRECRFERFPFDGLLPSIEAGRIVLPADEPGTRPYSEWQPSDGIELPVRYGALLLGRFVLVPRTPTCGVAIPSTSRTDAIALAQRAGEEIARSWTSQYSAPAR